MVSVTVRYLFYQPMDDKIKTWTLRCRAIENPDTEKALVDWPIVLQYDVKAKYRLICTHEVFFSPERTLNQPKPTRVCIRSITNFYYTAPFPFVCCFCFVRAFSFQGHTKIALMLSTAFELQLLNRAFSLTWPAAMQLHLFCFRKSSTSPGLL